MKKSILILLALLTISFVFVSCGEVKTLHCDSCGKAVEVGSGMDESWSIYCNDCEEKLGLDTLVTEE